MGQLISKLAEIRTFEPERIAKTLENRPRPSLKEALQGKDGKPEKLMVIACDHPARGVLAEEIIPPPWPIGRAAGALRGSALATGSKRFLRNRRYD